MLSCGFLLGDLECGSVAPCGSAVALPQALVRQSSRPVLACIIGAFRPCIAPMISSEEIPSR